MRDEQEIIVDESLVAYCGLYCGACPRYLKGKCPGCRTTSKSSWCKVKPCNTENGWRSCAECTQHEDVAACAKYNPLIIRIGEFVSRTSRRAGIQMIKGKGFSAFSQHMANHKLVSIKK